VFCVIDQNVKIFRGFVHHRPYFRRFSKNPFKNPPRFSLQSDVVTSALDITVLTGGEARRLSFTVYEAIGGTWRHKVKIEAHK